MTVLGADVGGSKVHMGLFAWEGGALSCLRLRSFRSAEHADLGTILAAFLSGGDSRVEAAVFGVAGPVQDGRAKITNLPWRVDAQQLGGMLGTDRVRVINDLEATAYGALTLGAQDCLLLNQGVAGGGALAVIAAGTGLGEGFLYWDGVQHHAAPSEGGHTDFAPRNDLEAELLAFLRPRFGHVSYERLVSGPGLVNVYEFLRDSGHAEEPPYLRARLQAEDPAAVISQVALAARVPLCVRALDLFTSIYGAEAGNLALKVLATGGVYVGGGIAPKISGKLADGTFMAAFCDKGRMAPLMGRMPVRVILEERTALRGAGYYAARLARENPTPRPVVFV